MKKQRIIFIIIFVVLMALAAVIGVIAAKKFSTPAVNTDSDTISAAYEPTPTTAAAEPTAEIEEIILEPNNKEVKLAPTHDPAKAPYRRQESVNEPANQPKVIVLDPGHGMTSNEMSADEKEAQGWVHTESGWGEWRHWKSGSRTEDCEGGGCSGRAPENGLCWYPIANGDRDGEGDINLKNALYAKQYLEEKGYIVRMTRSDNSNPSMTKRLESCYPNGDRYQEPDADAFVCIHSNAGGGRGSAYIEMSGVYDQYGISASYADDGNRLGQYINNAITSNTSLGEYSGGAISLPELILFCKSPVTIAYLEIGFFDNDSDMAILDSEAEAIGRSIAEGIDAYFNG